MSQLPNEFESREMLIDFCRRTFKSAQDVCPSVSPIKGGRKAAELKLKAIDPSDYARTRNFLSGSVTRLSPYIRHGVVSLVEVHEAVLDHESAKSSKGSGPRKLINELAWRDYWRRVLDYLGDAVLENLEPWKTGWTDLDYKQYMPQDILEGRTKVDFIDDTIHELYQTGYIHNQMRMKLAAYIVHFRRIHWRVGADWFLSHLLDGDLASNHLSWQWVASTFSHKPYIFNLENVRKWTGDRYMCDSDQYEPFDHDYSQIISVLFHQPSGEV